MADSTLTHEKGFILDTYTCFYVIIDCVNKCMFSNSKIIVWIIVISILTKIIVIMIFPIIEQPYYDCVLTSLKSRHCNFCKSLYVGLSQKHWKTSTTQTYWRLSRQACAGRAFCLRHPKFLFRPCCFGDKSISAENQKCTFGPFSAKNSVHP